MWQLIDIAYVIPAAVFIGYWIGQYLETKYEGDYFVNAVLIGAACGLILTITKIKRFVDQSNRHCKEEHSDDVAIQSKNSISKEQKQNHKTPTDQESQ